MLSSFALLRQSDADIVDQPLGAQLRPVNGEMVVGIKKVLPVQDVILHRGDDGEARVQPAAF